MSPAKLTQKRSRNRGPIAWKDGTACLVCGSHADVKPIYGDKLPGCCPRHWEAARTEVLRLIRIAGRTGPESG